MAHALPKAGVQSGARGGRLPIQVAIPAAGTSARVRTRAPQNMNRTITRGGQQAGRATAAVPPPSLTIAQVLQGVDRLNGNTPNADIERLLMAIDRHRRIGSRLPATNAYRGNWEWVQFEITRRLKRDIKDRDEAFIRLGKTFNEEVRMLARTSVQSARRPQRTMQQTQTQTQTGKSRGQVAKLRTVAA